MTIQELDSEENAALQTRIDLLSSNAESAIQLGVWLITTDISWSDYQFLSLHFNCVRAIRKKQVYCSELFNLLLEQCKKKYPLEDALFIWKAQQSYRIVMAFYSEDEQLQIFHRVQKTKSPRVAGLTSRPVSGIL